jgi:hypothetical protein
MITFKANNGRVYRGRLHKKLGSVLYVKVGRRQFVVKMQQIISIEEK